MEVTTFNHTSSSLGLLSFTVLALRVSLSESFSTATTGWFSMIGSKAGLTPSD